MKYPIPNDWNGNDWACYIVRWPKSLMWSALLRGLLMMPSKGRFWDERSGVIKDVQSVGWDIWAINGALTPCPDCVDNPVTNEPSETDSLQGCYFMECLDEIGECDMANGPCLPVKIENGKLYEILQKYTCNSHLTNLKIH